MNACIAMSEPMKELYLGKHRRLDVPSGVNNDSQHISCVRPSTRCRQVSATTLSKWMLIFIACVRFFDLP